MEDAPPPPSAPKPAFTHRWRLRRVLPERFGKLCRIVQKDHSKRPGWNGAKALWYGKVQIEFEDGTIVEASRMSIRPLRYGKSTGRPRKVVG